MVLIFNDTSEVEGISDRDKQGEKQGDRLLQKSDMNELVLSDILSFFNQNYEILRNYYER